VWYGSCCLFRARALEAGSVPMRHVVAVLGAWVVGGAVGRARAGRGDGKRGGDEFGDLPAVGKAQNGLKPRLLGLEVHHLRASALRAANRPDACMRFRAGMEPCYGAAGAVRCPRGVPLTKKYRVLVHADTHTCDTYGTHHILPSRDNQRK
jgi:hypothetical protein